MLGALTNHFNATVDSPRKTYKGKQQRTEEHKKREIEREREGKGGAVRLLPHMLKDD